MDTNSDVPRMDGITCRANPFDGKVRWSAAKSIWMSANYMVAIVGGVLTASWVTMTVFLVTTGITLCLGHSLGMHRRLVHNSYECPRWFERILIHLGVLVGMAGPFGMIRTHDVRDWAQRQRGCHEYLRHGKGFFHDAWWQLHCDFVLEHPPVFKLEERIAHDRFYLFMERTWMLQQLPLAILLFACGGFPWVIWGTCARISVSVTGHWMVGYFAHNCGQRDWHIEGAAVQGHNVPIAGLISMGEAWHNNHHAYPGSAKLGLFPGQADPGWWVLKVLERIGLVWNIRLPHDMPVRNELQRTGNRASYPLGI